MCLPIDKKTQSLSLNTMLPRMWKHLNNNLIGDKEKIKNNSTVMVSLYLEEKEELKNDLGS